MEKLTDNEIIKALECCSQKEEHCCLCPYKPIDNCCRLLQTNALDLINRQKSEIERLQKENHYMKLEIEEFARMIEECRACAIQDFEERLCEGRVSNDPVVIATKATLKIMGVKNGH